MPPRRTPPLLLLCLCAARGARDSPWCVDKDPSACASWAAGGECAKNSGFMRGHCMRSCIDLGACDMLDATEQALGSERIVLTTKFGDITLAFFASIAPVTVRHILRLFQLGCYKGDHFFRVDKGFVAQIQTVTPSGSCDKAEASKNVPGEFSKVRHTRGVLSMGRGSDVDSGGSSFSLLLGDAPHLDEQYTVFGRVMSGDEALRDMEKVETKKQGIFVMPLERIDITETRVLHTDTDVVPDLS